MQNLLLPVLTQTSGIASRKSDSRKYAPSRANSIDIWQDDVAVVDKLASLGQIINSTLSSHEHFLALTQIRHKTSPPSPRNPEPSSQPFAPPPTLPPAFPLTVIEYLKKNCPSNRRSLLSNRISMMEDAVRSYELSLSLDNSNSKPTPNLEETCKLIKNNPIAYSPNPKDLLVCCQYLIPLSPPAIPTASPSLPSPPLDPPPTTPPSNPPPTTPPSNPPLPLLPPSDPLSDRPSKINMVTPLSWEIPASISSIVILVLLIYAYSLKNAFRK